MVLSWCILASKTRPRRPKLPPRSLQDRPRRLPEASRRLQDSTRRLEDASSHAQLAKQNSSFLGLFNAFIIASPVNYIRVVLSQHGVPDASRTPKITDKMLPKPPQTSPRDHQTPLTRQRSLPRHLQNRPRRPKALQDDKKIACKTPPRPPQIASRRSQTPSGLRETPSRWLQTIQTGPLSPPKPSNRSKAFQKF